MPKDCGEELAVFRSQVIGPESFPKRGRPREAKGRCARPLRLLSGPLLRKKGKRLGALPAPSVSNTQ